MLTTRPKDVVNVTKIIPPISEAKCLEEARRKEIQLLLENLFEREEATIKMLIDCLLDIGYARLINKKVPTPVVKTMVRKVAYLSKSGVRIVAHRYVKRKFILSGFLTNFLINKIKNLIK